MNKKGQNAIEYVLLVAAVVIVFIAFLAPNGPFYGVVRRVLDRSVEQINLMAQDTPIIP